MRRIAGKANFNINNSINKSEENLYSMLSRITMTHPWKVFGFLTAAGSGGGAVYYHHSNKKKQEHQELSEKMDNTHGKLSQKMDKIHGEVVKRLDKNEASINELHKEMLRYGYIKKFNMDEIVNSGALSRDELLKIQKSVAQQLKMHDAIEGKANASSSKVPQ